MNRDLSKPNVASVSLLRSDLVYLGLPVPGLIALIN